MTDQPARPPTPRRRSAAGARQARSEATRRRIVDAAVILFDGAGYPATGLGDIIEAAGMTKGALYYHFDSKEALAAAIIEEGTETLLTEWRDICASPAPALESMIQGTFRLAQLTYDDPLSRTAAQLSRVLCGYNHVASATIDGWAQQATRQVDLAKKEGDLLDSIDALTVGETLLASVLGTQLLALAATGGADIGARLARTWAVLLPSIVVADAVPYFQEFLDREVKRLDATR